MRKSTIGIGETISRNGRFVPFGVGLACWPRGWEPDPGPDARLSRSRRGWEPDPGPQVGIGFPGIHIHISIKGLVNDLKKGVASLRDVANKLGIPGVNLNTAVLTGQNPIDALKADVSSFAQSANLAQAVSSGNVAAIVKNASARAKQFGININPKDAAILANVAAAAQSGDVSKVAAAAMGPGYPNAWNAATNGGKIFDPSLPAPPGLAYAKDAVPNTPANIAQHPLVAAVAAAPSSGSAAAAGGGYGPYPSATAGTTAGVGNLDRGGGGHGGGGHGGGGHGGGHGWHGGGRPGFRGRGFGGRGWGGGWGWGGGPWWPYVVVDPAEVACATWGDPVGIPATILPAARTTLVNAGGDPVAIRGADGGVYLLALGGPNLVTVRPCVTLGVGSAEDDTLRMMALDLVSSLQRTGAPQYATRPVRVFAQAWNAASADTQVATDGKYTREIEGALNAALSALAPGSGAAPTAVL